MYIIRQSAFNGLHTLFFSSAVAAPAAVVRIYIYVEKKKEKKRRVDWLGADKPSNDNQMVGVTRLTTTTDD